MIKWIKNNIKKFLIFIGFLAIVAAAPIIPEGNGLISVAKFENNITKEIVYIQIPDSQYADMGKRGGHAHNPTKEDFKLLYSYQYPVDSYEGIKEITTATSTYTIINSQPQFEDRDDLTSIFKIITSGNITKE